MSSLAVVGFKIQSGYGTESRNSNIMFGGLGLGLGLSLRLGLGLGLGLGLELELIILGTLSLYKCITTRTALLHVNDFRRFGSVSTAFKFKICVYLDR